MRAGAGGGNRTPDRLITNQLLYLLSYASRQKNILYKISSPYKQIHSVPKFSGGKADSELAIYSNF